MSKRLIILCTLIGILALPIIAYAQEDPIFVLTEDQINVEFAIPSTTTHTITNLEVDVEPDGVQIEFDMTTIQNGTTATHHIIAVLIGLAKPRVTQLEMEDPVNSSFTPTLSQRRAVANVVARAWSSYIVGVVEENQIHSTDNSTTIQALMESDGIHFFAVDNVPTEWCLECAIP